MTFSEFAQMMRRYIIEKNTDEYICKLIDLIWEETYPEDAEEDTKDTENKKEISNPIYDYCRNTLIKIYNGKSDISKEKANIILAHYNDEKFIDLINNGLNDTVRGDLKKDLEKVGITYKKKYELGKKCADLFKSILIDISKKSNTKKPNTSKLQKTSSNNKNVSAPQFSIPAQFEICFCCKYWSGNRPESLDPDISIKGKCMAEYNSEVKHL